MGLFCLFLILLALLPAHHRSQSPMEERIIGAALETLSARYPDEAHRFEVRVVRLQGDPEEGFPLRLRFINNRDVPRAHVRAEIQQDRDGSWLRTGWATLYVAHYDSVIVAKRRLHKRERVDESAFMVGWQDVTSFRGFLLQTGRYRRLLANDALIADQIIEAGEVVRENALRNPFAAQLGDLVQMHYKQGNINLKIPTRARNEGQIGDLIRVYASSTKNMYRVRLTDKGQAEWQATLD